MEIKFDLKNFDKYTKQMKADLAKHYAKVGVLSSKKQRTGEESFDNVSLAIVHEYGSIAQNILKRSFLKLTAEKKSDDMKQFIADNGASIFKQIMNGKTALIYSKLGAKWVSYINECFETEGFGTWAPLSEATLQARQKKTPSGKAFNPQILQDTGQLQRSITFEVK